MAEQLDPGALCTLEQVMTALGLTKASAMRQDQLRVFINEASSQILNFCNRPEGFHWVPQVTEMVAGFGRQVIMVTRTPLVRLISVTEGGSSVALTAVQTESLTGFIRKIGGVWDSTALQVNALVDNQLSANFDRSIVAVYESGWVTDVQVQRGDAPTRTIPADLRGAAISLAAGLWRSRPQIRDPNIIAESLQSHSVTYADGSAGGGEAGIPPKIAGILERYKRLPAGG